MARTPKVSVICITYNHEAYVREALEGFAAQQTDFPVEVIVADDKSTDATPAIIEEFAQRYPKLFKPVLRTKNLGAVPNFLDALSQAKGDYIALCEGDDYWTDPTKLQRQVDYLDAHPDKGGCFHTAQVKYQTGEVEDHPYPDVEQTSWYTTEELLRTNYVATNTVMYRRRPYENLPTDVMPFDWYLHLYHASFGPLAYMKRTMSVYRKHQGGMWWEFDRNRDAIWRQYGIKYVALFARVYELYKDKPKYEAIITTTLMNTLGTVFDTDAKYGTKQFPAALKYVPDGINKLIAYEREEQAAKTAKIAELTTDLLRVGDERSELVIRVGEAETAYQLASQELDNIKRSRTWRLAKALAKLSHGSVSGNQSR